MKLDWCPKHKGAKDKTLTCYRLRHENGAPVTDEEAMAEINKLRAENERLRALLAEAADDVADWGEYASPYFQQKYDLAGDVKKYRDAALTPNAAVSGSRRDDG